ncbi:hypothetical protein ACGF8B_12685 [Streptomyces sp. NPDC047917]|uniref:hypothetical protein n=1 Tax=Streptomyces sp. NPDC047917 TaxID=3365491 RepID=UPI00371E2BB8
MEWTTATFHYQYGIGDRVYPLGTLVGTPTVYRAGGDYRDDWMSAPSTRRSGDRPEPPRWSGRATD